MMMICYGQIGSLEICIVYYSQFPGNTRALKSKSFHWMGARNIVKWIGFGNGIQIIQPTK